MIEPNSLYLGDCLNLMDQIAGESVDAIVADLPFGSTQCRWDSIISLVPLWSAFKRIVKPNGAIVLNAADPFTSLLITSNLSCWKQTLVWEKNVASNFLNAKRQHLAIHENVVLFSYGTPPYHPQMQPGKPYVQKRSGKDDTGECYGKIGKRTDTVNVGERYPTTIRRFNRETGLHPTQKPLALCEYLIKTYTNEGDLVLDCCAGSGTTLLAARNTGRRYIGIEKEPEYYEIARKRLGLVDGGGVPSLSPPAQT